MKMDRKCWLNRVIVCFLMMIIIIQIPMHAYPDEKRTVAIGTNAEYAPFEYLDSNGDLTGFDIDLMNAIAKEAGFEVKWVDLPFDSLLGSIEAGDIEAMEQLTLEDMDTYTAVSSRSKKEDLFTIVTSYFMPHSVECDKYSVLGKIINVMEMQNSRTKEIFYYLSVECNSIQIEFTIAKDDLMGEPKVGRRFKGILWLQGEVDCL